MSISLRNTFNLPSGVLGRTLLFAGLTLAASISSAAAPTEANFILGMDIHGQRLNLYTNCEEGNVTCDDMRLIAPDLTRLLKDTSTDSRLDTSPYTIKRYSAKTMHSLCKDGVTPCRFHGYSFEDKDFDGFIDPASHKISISSKSSEKQYSATYQENDTYLPIASQSALIDQQYKVSDKALNDGYKGTRQEVRRLYGDASAASLKQDQIQWIKARSKNCGANAAHEPRTQAEKVCFIQQNTLRDQDWFLWID